MLELLDIEPAARVLEVGTGFGYQAAVMADMGAEVFSVEVVEEFAEAAKARFGLLGYDIRCVSATGREDGPSMRRSTASSSPRQPKNRPTH